VRWRQIAAAIVMSSSAAAADHLADDSFDVAADDTDVAQVTIAEAVQLADRLEMMPSIGRPMNGGGNPLDFETFRRRPVGTGDGAAGGCLSHDESLNNGYRPGAVSRLILCRFLRPTNDSFLTHL
jgi:hypothetical protein